MNNIIVVNEEDLEQKIEAIRSDGDENLFVLSDFDRTLTHGVVNGKKIPSLISILRDGDYLDSDYSQRATALYEHYHKIEINQSITEEEKINKMEEWWEAHLALLTEKGLKKEDLLRMVKDERIVLRNGVLQFLKTLSERSIPLVIFSANGCGEAVELFFNEKDINYSNTYFLINRFYWSKEGLAMGAKDPKIHVMNKNGSLIKEDKEIYENVGFRKNIILFGDSIGDTKMTSGINTKTTLKVGFLNTDYNDKEQLEEYKKHYDIVISGESDFYSLDNIL